MKAALVVEKEKVEIQEIPVPEIKDDEVLIKVHSAGVCGSDLHLFKGTHAFRKPPAILGHEVSGDVIKIGSKVTKFNIGDRVTVEPHVGDKNCYYFQQGLINISNNKVVPGTPAWIGTFVEYFNAPEIAVYKIDDSVTYEIGTLVEPLAVAVHTLARASNPNKDCITILGAGTIGLLVQVVAREMGYKTIICSDPAPFNREMAMKLGATAVIDPLTEDLVAKVMELTNNRGADLTIVAAGAPNIMDQASNCTAKRGEIGLVAMIVESYPFYSYSVVFKEQNIYGAMTYQTEDFVKALDMINGGLDLDGFITHQLCLDETQKGLDILNNKTEGVVKVLININK